MSKIVCPMPHCVNKGPDNECRAEIVELMFGLVIQLAGRGAEAYMRCSQHMTMADLQRNSEGPKDG